MSDNDNNRFTNDTNDINPSNTPEYTPAEKLYNMIGNIDDAYILEASEKQDSNAKATSPAPVQALPKRKPITRIVMPVLASVAALTLIVIGIDYLLTSSGGGPTPTTTRPTTTAMTTTAPTEVTTTAAFPETEYTTTVPRDSTIPADKLHIPNDTEIFIYGEGVTDEEAKAYFDENLSSIREVLSDYGVTADHLYIKEKGFGHIELPESRNGYLSLDTSSRDYLIYNGNADDGSDEGELVARIRIRRDLNQVSGIEREIFCDDTDFKAFESYLKEHRGEEICFVYAGWNEIAIAPDGTFFCLNDPYADNLEEYFEVGANDPYASLHAEGNSYTP
ncbi:MAG: hypothetical protein IKG93_13145 [Clostridiales bacterium]|nr:hypothetical protein [Clostridiales bacterium]